MLGEGVREVVAELEFMLAGFLRDVDVCAEADAVGKGEVWSASVGVDEVVPVLEAGGEVVDRLRRKDGGKGDVGQDEVVDGVVAFGGVDLGCGLIVVALVVLSGVADVDLFVVVEEVIEAAVVALLIEWGGDGVGGNGAERDGEGEFLIGEVGDGDLERSRRPS